MSVAHENIGEFQVPVEKAFRANFNEPWNDVLQNPDSLSLGEFASPLENNTEVAFIAKFGYDVGVVMLPDDIVTAKNVIVTKCAEGFDFAVEHLSVGPVFVDFLHVEPFDGDGLVWY